MTTQPHAERAHKIWAPSMGHRWADPDEGCTAAPFAIAKLPEQEQSEASLAGTEAHEEIERCFGPLNGEHVDPATMEIKQVDPDHPAAYGIAMLIAYVRQLPPGRMWIERPVDLTKDIGGTPDIRHWHEESATLTIPDFKNGFVGVEAKKNRQLRIYAQASILTDNLPAKWIRYVIVQPNDFRPPEPGERHGFKQWSESADDLFAFAQRVAGIPAGPLVFRAGEHCTYCPLFGRCEPTRDLLAKLATVMQHPADDVPAAQVAMFLTLKKPVTDWFASLEKAQTKKARAGAVPPGMKLVQTVKHRAWRNEDAARAAVLAKLGPDALSPPTPAQAEKLGMTEAEVAALSERPDGGPALAFASDKRPEWRQKSASEMFAGIGK